MSGDSSQFEGLSTHRLESILRRSFSRQLRDTGEAGRREREGASRCEGCVGSLSRKTTGLLLRFASGEEVPSETFSKTIPSKVRNLGGLHFFSRQRISNNTGFEL